VLNANSAAAPGIAADPLARSFEPRRLSARVAPQHGKAQADGVPSAYWIQIRKNAMASNFQPLKSVLLSVGTRITESQSARQRMTLDSPALESMTDLVVVSAASIEPKRTIDEANTRMLVRGVRMLFVLGATQDLLGLITANDVLGEKPMRVVRNNGIPHSDVLVEDIMTAAKDLEVLEYADVKNARLGDIVATLRNTGRQHALVVAKTAGGPYIRGLFSASQIARDLGIAVQTPAIYKTFAEIEAVMQRDARP
jgi:CBS-domain-containing membrane protein